MADELTKRDRTLRDKMIRLGFGSTPQKARVKIAQICKAMNYDPIVFMIEAARDGYIKMTLPDSKEEIKVPLEAKDILGIHKEIAQYLAPKLRAVDVQAEINANVTINLQKFAGTPIECEMEGEMIRPVVGEAEAVPLEEMKVPELRDLCDNMGLSKQGNKDELIARIQEKRDEQALDEDGTSEEPPAEGEEPEGDDEGGEGEEDNDE